MMKNHIGVPEDAVKQLDVIITAIVDVGVLGVVCVDHWCDYQSMRDNIRRIFPTLSPVDKPSVGMLYVVQSQRVRLLSLHNDTTDVSVLFVDQGHVREIPRRSLRHLEDEHLQRIPEMGQRLVLANLQPETLSHPDGIWLDEDRHRFVHMLKERQPHENAHWHCQLYSVVGRELRVFLFPSDCQSSFERAASLNEEMMKAPHFAEMCVEPLVSEMNHLQRDKTLVAKLDPDKKFLNHFKDVNVCSSLEIESRAKEISDLLSEKQMIVQSKTSMVRGPQHPLQMKLKGVCRSTMGKTPIVSSDSVNSIMIDDQSSSHTDRLLVAGIVEQNARNMSNLVLRHTTLLPHIHGLAMMTALLFCPFAELRVDHLRSAYSGVCCGLGYDTELNANNEESTMEMHADVMLDKDDINLINEVRCGLSLIFHSVKLDFIQTEIIRPLIQQHIFQLFSKQRAFVHMMVMDQEKCGVWRQISPEYVTAANFSQNVVSLTFPPHCQVKDVASDSGLWMQDDRWPHSQEEADWRSRLGQRFIFVNGDLNSMACRNTTSSLQNNCLSMVGVCEICNVVLRDRQHIINHLDVEDGHHQRRLHKLNRTFQM